MKKVLSLVLAITMLISSMAITVNATDDQTITLDGDRVETSVISCTGTLTIEGKGSLTCPGINAKNIIFKSGYVQIIGSSDNAVLNVSENITLDGAVVRVINKIGKTSICGSIIAKSGILTSEITSQGIAEPKVVDTKSINLLNGMAYYVGRKVLTISPTDQEKFENTDNTNQRQFIIAKSLYYPEAFTDIDFSDLDGTYVFLNSNIGKFDIPSNITSENSSLFYSKTTNSINITSNITGSGTIVCYSENCALGLECDGSFSNSSITLISHGTSGINTVFPSGSNPSNPPQPTSPTNKNFSLVGEIINQTKNSVTIGYKIVNNDGIYEIMLKPIFDEQNIEVFVDKNALGSSWSDVLSKEGYAYELYCNNASTKTNTNLAIITYTNIKADDTFGLEYSYTPDDSGSITANTNEITIQALTHQAVFHFMYNGSEINTVTHTDVEIETTLTDLSELENNIHWFKQSKWYSDANFTSPITYMPNNNIDVYCNYEFNVKTGDLNGSGTVSADDLTLLRRYRISDTDNFVFINDENDAFNTYDENKNYIFLCCANVNSINYPADTEIDGSDVFALSGAICAGKEGSADYSYMLSDDESSVIKRQ